MTNDGITNSSNITDNTPIPNTSNQTSSLIQECSKRKRRSPFATKSEMIKLYTRHVRKGTMLLKNNIPPSTEKLLKMNRQDICNLFVEYIGVEKTEEVLMRKNNNENVNNEYVNHPDKMLADFKLGKIKKKVINQHAKQVGINKPHKVRDVNTLITQMKKKQIENNDITIKNGFLVKKGYTQETIF